MSLALNIMRRNELARQLVATELSARPMAMATKGSQRAASRVKRAAELIRSSLF
jgi:hypothetical protein